MNTQYERNSLSMAATSYRRRERKNRIINSIAAFYFFVTIICAALGIIILSLPQTIS